ncbi:Type VI secretion system effector, Hcp1 family protein [Sulfitobacter noctilucae]|uniref:Hcp family type VI secretion system effector n=1 Tax=Sulfitobacter noctilucae TaxID=1342302 RepID=UPI00046A42D8|nr:type VI secretion system tube protein Hcp [Sulfitobacter noctilucae]KIN70276.1 Type VI secretion system effector, Hcp1 family protein [Sulfitobacter noctilucae]
MAANMFVHISDIPGDATEINHDKWIVIQSANFEMERSVDMTDLGSNQRAHANTNFQKIEVTSQIGIASNEIAKSVANGTVRPEIKIEFCRSGDSAAQGLKAFSVWTLKHVIIDKYSIAYSEDGIPEETWALAYIGVEHEYKETNQQTGALTTKNVFKWNLRTGDVS